MTFSNNCCHTIKILEGKVLNHVQSHYLFSYTPQFCFVFLCWPLDFLGGSDGKSSAYKVETQVPSLGREHPLEKEMAIHSSTLAWKIPWTEERGRLQSTGSQRVRHDWATLLSLFTLHFLTDSVLKSDLWLRSTILTKKYFFEWWLKCV